MSVLGLMSVRQPLFHLAKRIETQTQSVSPFYDHAGGLWRYLRTAAAMKPSIVQEYNTSGRDAIHHKPSHLGGGIGGVILGIDVPERALPSSEPDIKQCYKIQFSVGRTKKTPIV